MPTQAEAIDALVDERDYQDRRWGGAYHEPAGYILFMQDYLNKAIRAITVDERDAALCAVRKVAALGIACMEQNGIVTRDQEERIVPLDPVQSVGPGVYRDPTTFAPSVAANPVPYDLNPVPEGAYNPAYDGPAGQAYYGGPVNGGVGQAGGGVAVTHHYNAPGAAGPPGAQEAVYFRRGGGIVDPPSEPTTPLAQRMIRRLADYASRQNRVTPTPDIVDYEANDPAVPTPTTRD